jgi:hypothetical protein
MLAEFGASSAVFEQTTERLSRIFATAGQTPPVAARFREWQRYRPGPQDQETQGEYLFIHQTYLALLARLTARRFVAPKRLIANTEELLEVVNVDYFSRRGIGNYGEGDIFSWLPLDRRWELGLDDLVLETVKGLADAVAAHDLSNAQPGILDDLYQQASPISSSVPEWLVEHVVVVELGLMDDLGPSLLVPVCGTGSFLSAAVQAMRRSVAQRNGDEIDVLFEAPEKVRGMERDPLAVALARLNYLLAFGNLVQQEHPPFLMPVYLAGPAGTELRTSDDSTVTLSTEAGEFPLPGPFISNPLMLDWVLGRLTNYMDGAQLRLHVQSEDLAVQEVLNAFYNYLTAGKPRTPVPEALTPAEADTVLDTARSLVHLHIHGEGTLWLHLVQNLAAPAIFARLGFDRVASHGPASHFDTYSEAYLRPEGRTAIVTTLADAEAHAGGKRLVRVESRPPNAALLITGPEQRTSL